MNNVILSHLRTKDSTGIHKQCIRGFLHSRDTSKSIFKAFKEIALPGLHSDVHWCALDAARESYCFEASNLL